MKHKVKIFLDSASIEDIRSSDHKVVSGFTTNPTLMKKSGITNYADAAKIMLKYLKRYRPKNSISLEVFADDFDEMYRQAKIIDAWASNVYIKIPVTNTKAEPSVDLVKTLSDEGVKVNVTAVFTIRQARKVAEKLSKSTPNIISIFAGRIADAGIDPMTATRYMVDVIKGRNELSQVLWASPRQVYDAVLAEKAGCDIITMSPDLVKKLPLLGKDLDEYSLETVKMFYNDAQSVGYSL